MTFKILQPAMNLMIEQAYGNVEKKSNPCSVARYGLV